MATLKISDTASQGISSNTLRHAAQRTLAFLQGADNHDISARLSLRGWRPATKAEGWRLLKGLEGSAAVPVAASDAAGRHAIDFCERFVARDAVAARAMLELTHPEQAAFLFHDLAAARGTPAVLFACNFLARYGTLVAGASRKDTRKADRESLAILDRAGLTKKVVHDLQRTVDEVQSTTAVADVEQMEARDAAEAERLDTLRKLHAWVSAWSDIARTVITRRDQLIHLGIAKRRSNAKKAKAPAPSPAPAAPAAPSPAPAAPSAPMIADDDGPASRAA